jgi:ribosomal protein S21
MSISVEVKGNIERAIRLLKKKMQSEGVQRELKHRRFKGNSNTDDFMRNRVSRRKGKDLRPAEGDANLEAGFDKGAQRA